MAWQEMNIVEAANPARSNIGNLFYFALNAYVMFS